jgi:hypothetical protein
MTLGMVFHPRDSLHLCPRHVRVTVSRSRSIQLVRACTVNLDALYEAAEFCDAVVGGRRCGGPGIICHFRDDDDDG